eukprot:5334433-Pleurochrysis_carterae.AAC.2
MGTVATPDGGGAKFVDMAAFITGLCNLSPLADAVTWALAAAQGHAAQAVMRQELPDAGTLAGEARVWPRCEQPSTSWELAAQRRLRARHARFELR